MKIPAPINGGKFSLSHIMWSRAEWIIEPKWDGWRVVMDRDGIFSKHGKRVIYPGAESLVIPIPEKVEWFDGELIGTRDKGFPAFIIFDAKMKGRWTWMERREFLERRFPVTAERPSCGVWLTSYSKTAEIWHEAKKANHEGIVCKKIDSCYPPESKSDWIKFRFREQS